MLRKLNIEQVFECDSSKNSIKIIEEYNVKIVFIDNSTIGHDLVALVHLLKTCTKVEIVILGLQEKIPTVKSEINIKSKTVYFLSKPLILTDLKNVLYKTLGIELSKFLI